MAERIEQQELEGRVAVVTGAAGLLGEHFAGALAEAGADVVLVDVDGAESRRRASVIAGTTGRRSIAVPGDVSEASCWEEIVARTVDEFGGIDVLVNGAALTNSTRSANYGRAVEDFPREDWDAILDVNLTGTFLGCQVVGRQMLAQGRGSIVNIASMYGVVSPTHTMYEGTGVVQPIAYSVSKAGVIALTRYLATMWAPRGVRVNAITPGGVFSGQGDDFVARYSAHSPSRRMARPEELRSAVLYLASDASSYCVGHNLVVDGGWTAW